jgi:hypothetical protein
MVLLSAIASAEGDELAGDGDGAAAKNEGSGATGGAGCPDDPVDKESFGVTASFDAAELFEPSARELVPETFSKSKVSVSLSAASSSSIISRIVRGRSFGSLASMRVTSDVSSGGICRVGTRSGTRSSIARFLSKCG